MASEHPRSSDVRRVPPPCQVQPPPPSVPVPSSSPPQVPPFPWPSRSRCFPLGAHSRPNMRPDLRRLLSSAPPYPQRVVCLTEETTETLYRIGAGDLVIGVSGFTVRPKEARRKPRVSSFLDANFDRITE